MAIIDNNEFTSYGTFNTSGIVTSDTFNSWRKKTNGIINEVDRAHERISNISITNIGPSQLSSGAPTWTNAGVLSTYSNAQFKAGSLAIGTSNDKFEVGNDGVVVAQRLLVKDGTLNAPSISFEELSRDTGFNHTADGRIDVVCNAVSAGNFTSTGFNGNVNGGTITGTSLNVSNGAITGGVITGTSLNAGSGTITGGTITGTSLNAGSGTITGGAITATTLSSNGSVQIQNDNPSLHFRDTNHATATLHCNGGIFYILRSTTPDTVTWDTARPFYVDLNSGNATFGFNVAVAGTLYVNGSITSSNDVVAFSTSDRKFKDNIANITDPLEKIAKINGVSFDWNDKQSTFSGHDIGVIAQEVEEVLPEIVTIRDDGSKAVKYDKMVALLIECVKELSVKVERLENVTPN